MGQDGSGCRRTGHSERRREEPTGWAGRRREGEEEGRLNECSTGPAFPFWGNLRSSDNRSRANAGGALGQQHPWIE